MTQSSKPQRRPTQGGGSENQSEKFKRAARELGADDTNEEALARALRKMKRQPEKVDKDHKDRSGP